MGEETVRQLRSVTSVGDYAVITSGGRMLSDERSHALPVTSELAVDGCRVELIVNASGNDSRGAGGIIMEERGHPGRRHCSADDGRSRRGRRRQRRRSRSGDDGNTAPSSTTGATPGDPEMATTATAALGDATPRRRRDRRRCRRFRDSGHNDDAHGGMHRHRR